MRVRFTPFAFAEYADVLSYIEKPSQMGARNVQRRIDHVIKRLEEFPHIGTPTARTSVRLVVANPYPYLI